MDLAKVFDYIKQQNLQGVGKGVIYNNLISAGWKKEIIDQAYQNVVPTENNVSVIITEQNYPIQFKWVYKSLIGFFTALLITIIMLFFGYFNFYFVFLIFYTPIYFIILILRRKNFHYSIEDKIMTLKQGILSKQERHIPYGVIQNVFVKQDIFDRLFSLASLTLENASSGAGALNAGTTKAFGLTIQNQKNQGVEMLGFKGNKISIPGLIKEDAESLKLIVLKKIKENPIEDSQSGL